MSIHPSVIIHDTAIIDKGAKLGANSRVWHWVHICENAIIGEGCSLGQNVFIGNKVLIGNNVKIQNNVSVYDNVTLGNDVFCGPSVVFTNVYNPRSAINRKDEYRSTNIAEGVTLGANSTIVCGITIGQHAFIAAGALVNKVVKPYSLMMGIPARHVGWMSKFGERIPVALNGYKEWVCPHTGEIYRLNGENLEII